MDQRRTDGPDGRDRRGRGRQDFVYGPDGRPVRDRFGRPVHRRTGQPRDAERPHPQPRAFSRRDDVVLGRRQRGDRSSRGSRSDEDRPRQYLPPRDGARRGMIAGAAAGPAGSGRTGAAFDDVYDSRGRRRADYDPRYRDQSGRSSRPAPQYPPRRPARRPQPERGRGPARRRQAPRLRTPGCSLGCVGRALAVLLVLALVGALFADVRLNRVDATPSDRVANTAGTNWLLVGSDSRQGLSDADIERLGTGGDIGVGRTDTVMLLHIPTFGKATLVSLPRDSYVAVPGHGMDKLNSAFTYGGPKLLVETVEQATSLRIDHYAEIGMGGLANTVDAVGGVEVCPDEPITDPLASLDIPAGCQKVDGPTALGYVRTRATAGGDLDRVARQREFFSALLDRITSPATLLNPLRSAPMLMRVTGGFTVGTGDHVWHLARVALAMRGVETETVPVGGFADYDVGSVVLWDEAGAEELFGSMR